MNQKLENQLQLALQTSEETRAKTEDLNVGFDQDQQTWELIVKYHGNLDVLRELGIKVEELIAGYAILTAPESLVERLAGYEQIEYVEKPKRFFFEQIDPSEGSCLEQVTGRDLFLTGEGVLMAVIDSGINYALPVFRKEDGSTRIRFLYDLSLTGEDGEAGIEYDENQINRALSETDPRQRALLIPSTDLTGHGTAVTGIAAGAGGGYLGIAPKADLLVAKLGVPASSGFPRTTEIMRAVTWAVNKSLELQMPLVINLSFGNSYGAHDGSSLLERFLDNVSEIGRNVICVGSGNDGAGAGHLAGRLMPTGAFYEGGAELAVAEYEQSLSIQLWKNYSDPYRILLKSPGGAEKELPQSANGGKYTLLMEQTRVLVYIGEPTPYSVTQEVYFELIPEGRPYINSGVWTIKLQAFAPVTGNFYFYLPSAAGRNRGTAFFRPTPDVTLTIPSTAAKVITVGAYDSVYHSYADFSGRGYADEERTIGVVTAGLAKPDLCAPGVNVLAPDRYGGFLPVTGTSFATPIVSGSAALLMEWGIVRGRDPFLYGQKLKAYLRKGAEPLRGEVIYPNEKPGWGKLCLRKSFPL